MNKKIEIIVIGMQHSCSRFILNKLTKHPDIIYKYHYSIPSDDIASPIKYLMKYQQNKLNKNTIVIFIDRDINYVLNSNDNINNYLQWKIINEITENEKMPYSDNFIENYKLSINDLIKNLLNVKNIRFTFFSMSSYEIHEEHYLKKFIEFDLGLNYEIYPKNLNGIYCIYDNTKLDTNNNNFIIDINGDKIERQHELQTYGDINLININQKYYNKKQYWNNDGSLIKNVEQDYTDNIIYEIKNYIGNNNSFFKCYKTKTEIISNIIKDGNKYDENLYYEIQNLFENKILNNQCICLEGGSHIGLCTVLLGKLCKIVHSFEPYEISKNILIENLRLNNINNVIVSNKALSNKNYNIDVEFHNPVERNVGSWGINFTKDKDYVNINGLFVNINIITIDSLNLEKINLIILDINNNELNAINGAIETIKKFKPIIILINRDGNISTKFNILTKNGYIYKKCNDSDKTEFYIFIYKN